MNRNTGYRNKKPRSNLATSDNDSPTEKQKGANQAPANTDKTLKETGEGGDRNSQAEKGHSDAKKASISWLAVAGSTFALVSVLASMFGYGVVFGIAQRFGQSQETFFNSPFDLVSMVWPGVLMLMTSLSRVLSWELVFVAYEQAKWPLLVLGSVVFICMLAFMGLKRRDANSTAIITRVKNCFQGDRGLISSTLISLAASCAAMVAAMAVQVLSAFAIVALFVIAIYIPALGAVSGSAYIEKFVITPSECASLIHQSMPASNDPSKNESKRDNKKIDTVSCVLVNAVDPSKPFYKAGRLVLASANAILLWNPETGVSSRVPLAGMDVSSLSNEELKAANKLLAQYPADCLTIQAGGGSLAVKGGKSASDHCSR